MFRPFFLVEALSPRQIWGVCLGLPKAPFFTGPGCVAPRLGVYMACMVPLSLPTATLQLPVRAQRKDQRWS